MNLGYPQVKPKVQTSQMDHTHSHHLAPARSMSASVASSSGPPSNAVTSNCLAKSSAYSRGDIRLNPKRASMPNVRHSEKGNPTSCSSNNRLATTQAPRHGSPKVVRAPDSSSTAKPPPRVSAILTSASTTVA